MVVCSGSHVAGLEIMNLTLMKQLQENGHSVFCLASGWNNGDFTKRLETLSIPFQCVKLGNLYASRPAWTLVTILNLPEAVVQIKNLLKKYEPDIVILNEHRNFLYTGFLWKGWKMVYWEHNLPALSIFNKITYKKLQSKAHALIACSEFVKNRLEVLTPGASNIAIVHNGIDTAPGNNLKKDTTETTDKLVRLGIIGQVIPRKGHLLLIEALGALLQKNINCAVYIYGNDQTEYAARVREFVLEHGLTDRVHWKGFLSDKNNIFSQLDIVVVPSTDEPFGLVALEPALWEIPVVAARSGGLPEIITHEFNGLLFTPGNYADLYAQLERLICQPQLRLELGRRAKTVLTERFSADRMADRFMETLALPDTADLQK